MLQDSTAYINNNDYFFAFWLVLYYDLLEDRYIDVDSPWFKFDSCLILWTNHNSSLSIATNQFVSFYVDNRLRESAIFVSVKAAKFEIKCFFPHIYFNSILYKSGSMLPCICSVIYHRGPQNVVRTVAHKADVLATFWRHL